MHFDITQFHYDPQGAPDQWEAFLREYEVRHALEGFECEHFTKGLELGCGTGRHSKCLAHYCRRLVAVEYNQDRLLEKSDGKITFLVGDAQDLSPFDDAEFDLVFSSNLIEHLPDVDRCMGECVRVTTEDGLIVHTVPNRTWKVASLAMYYPYLAKRLLGRVLSRRDSAGADAPEDAIPKRDSNLKPVQEGLSLRKLLPPKPHGISRNNWREFWDFGQRHWIECFEKNGLEVVRVVRQPFYFGFGFHFPALLRLGNRLGLSACTGYVLRKTRRADGTGRMS